MKTLLFDFAIRLLGAATARRTLETANALYALANYSGKLSAGARARWDELAASEAEGRFVGNATSVGEFAALLDEVKGTREGAEVLEALKRVAARRPLESWAGNLSSESRKNLLKALARFMQSGPDYLPEDPRVKLGAAILVVYLYDLRQHGEITMIREEQALFREVLGRDLGLAATVTYAQYVIWFSALAEDLGFCDLEPAGDEAEAPEEFEAAAVEAGRG